MMILYNIRVLVQKVQSCRWKVLRGRYEGIINKCLPFFLIICDKKYSLSLNLNIQIFYEPFNPKKVRGFTIRNILLILASYLN